MLLAATEKKYDPILNWLNHKAPDLNLWLQQSRKISTIKGFE